MICRFTANYRLIAQIYSRQRLLLEQLLNIHHKDFQGLNPPLKTFCRRLHSPPPITRILIYLYHILFRHRLSRRIFSVKKLKPLVYSRINYKLLHTVYNIPQITTFNDSVKE